MLKISRAWLSLLLGPVLLANAQQECYFGPGAENRGPSNLVPCTTTGESACCLLGDTCLSGNTCYNYASGDLYQYGCTDITYEDSVCPYKCGWNASKLQIGSNLLRITTDFEQPCHHGQLWSTALILQV